MNLKVLLKNIGELAIAQKLVNYSAAGTSLAQINGTEVEWYALLFTSPTGTHIVQDDTTRYELTLYFVSRLLQDYSNDIDLYSSAIENLKNIIKGIRSLPGVVGVEDGYTVRNFADTEKFNDSLAGAYATIRVQAINDTVCFEEE